MTTGFTEDDKALLRWQFKEASRDPEHEWHLSLEDVRFIASLFTENDLLHEAAERAYELLGVGLNDHNTDQIRSDALRAHQLLGEALIKSMSGKLEDDA